MGMTPQHFHTIPTSCAIQVANYSHHKTLFMHVAYSYALNEQGTQLSIAHPTFFHRSISAMFSSNKISISTPTDHIPYILYIPYRLMHSTVFAYRQDRPYLPCSEWQPHCTHTQHNPLPMHINMHYTPSTTHHTFHNPLHTTNTQSIFVQVTGKWHKM